MVTIEEFCSVLYCCPVIDCSKEYKNKFNLKKHVKTIHFGKKPFSCLICNKKFVSKQNLREHRFIHSGIKPYKCTYCGKKFRQASHLSLHRRIHKRNYLETLQNAVKIEQIEEKTQD